MRKALGIVLEPRVDPVLFGLSRDYVGDTAETVSLLWPDGDGKSPPSLTEVVEAASDASLRAFPRVLESLLDRLDVKGRFALIKFLSGALRAGASARIAKTALAQAFGREVSEIEEVWHGLRPPYTELFAWLEGKAERPDPGLRPTFRPVMLAHPIEEGDCRAADQRQRQRQPLLLAAGKAPPDRAGN